MVAQQLSGCMTCEWVGEEVSIHKDHMSHLLTMLLASITQVCITTAACQFSYASSQFCKACSPLLLSFAGTADLRQEPFQLP